MILWRPARPSRTNTKKRCPFYHRGLECKIRKLRDSWSNKQVWPWSTKWSRSKANRILPRERNGHSKHSLPTAQDYTWTSPYGQYWNQIDYILCCKDGEAHTVSKTRLGADCGSDHETMETVRDFIWGGSKVTADGDCSHEIKRCLLLWRKAMTNIDGILISRDITLPTKIRLVKSVVFPAVMYECERLL